MELGRALSQISEIHGHLTRSEVYRGLGPMPVAMSGALALAAGALQGRLLPEASPNAFLVYWLAVAAVASLACAADILRSYLFREDPLARRRTLKVVFQVLPCLTAGAVLTAVLTWRDTDLVALLPGLWAVVFSLGVFAARPYLPKAIGWVALFYLAAGPVLLVLGEAHGQGQALGLGMGVTFGMGQLLTALVIHQNVTRVDDVG